MNRARSVEPLACEANLRHIAANSARAGERQRAKSDDNQPAGMTEKTEKAWAGAGMERWRFSVAPMMDGKW